ncbi:MAG: Coenzyme F420 hydrogenase/dehydrogenase, beta subunit C-terminal domain [Eubacterium sp.]|nr:Coenzyme F420 hydrogenase/dehydrogenase, beta subunit C-terminal domain [Eubacterium sp.]
MDDIMLRIKKECTGCMACVNSCPAGAISITENEYGFLFPVIDETRCVNCGLCERVCPIDKLPEGSAQKAFNESDRERTFPVEAWSMYHKSSEVVGISSSGGAFYALAKSVLDEDGIVYGCFFDINEKRARLADTDSMPLEALLTSKYVENSIGADGFRRVEKELSKGRRVLFCGTPCHTAGLKSYLKRDYENLLLVDFACGGVAAQPYLSDYIERLEKKYDSKVKRISFRDKYYGWGQYCFLAEFENGEIYRKTAMADPYFFSFLRSSMQRLSCHGCHFSDDHKSDISLSDFWRCDHFDVDGNARKGLSLVLVFSEKGKAALRAVSDVMHMEQLPVDKASYQLSPRYCPEEKLSEIERDMKMAYLDGVEVLRNNLLTKEQREAFDERQRIMDDPVLAAENPDIVGTGQIVPVRFQ